MHRPILETDAMNFETICGIGRIQRQSLFGQTQSIIEFAFDFSRAGLSAQLFGRAISC